MAVVKRMVCLANSRKPGGTCVAGRVVSNEGIMDWIRPVSSRPGEAVVGKECQYADGGEPLPLDIIDVPVLKPAPHDCQTENWLLDSSRRWSKVAAADLALLMQCLDDPETIWTNGFSTRDGENDQIPLDKADLLPNSLMLVRVPWIKLYVYEGSRDHGLRVRGWFPHHGQMYGLRVTDVQVEQKLFTQDVRLHGMGESFLTISLTEPFRKADDSQTRHKVIAAIIDGSRLHA